MSTSAPFTFAAIEATFEGAPGAELPLDELPNPNDPCPEEEPPRPEKPPPSPNEP